MRQRGMMLVAVMGLLVLLSLLALGLGHMATGELSGLRSYQGYMRAYAAARSGILAQEEAILRRPSQEDVPGAAGTAAGRSTGRTAWQKVAVGPQAYFDAGFTAGEMGIAAFTGFVPGPADETGRLNLNAVNDPSTPAAAILGELVDAVSPGSGIDVVAGLIRFIQGPDRHNVVRPLYHIEELFFVDAMTPKIFSALKDSLTVYPAVPTGPFSLNLMSASDRLVKAAFRAGWNANGMAPASGESEAMSYLNCRGRQLANSPEPFCAPPAVMLAYDTGLRHSGIYRLHATGTDRATGITATVEEVAQFPVDGMSPPRIYYRHRD